VTEEVRGPRWTLTLYVSGASPRSTEAITVVRRICDEDLAGQVDLTVLDAFAHPDRVLEDHILAIPTLIKHAPLPMRHLVGNLSDPARVRVGLDLGPEPLPPPAPEASSSSAATPASPPSPAPPAPPSSPAPMGGTSA
jgi:circadian clock protein KaiB